MSLIKAMDVPKHLADRMKSRRIASRLSSRAAAPPVVPAKKPGVIAPNDATS